MKAIPPILFLVLLPLLSAAEPMARDLGIPVKSVSWVRLHPGRALDTAPSMTTPGELVIPYTYDGHGPNGRPSLLVSMGQNNGGLMVLDVDLASGHCLQFNAKSAAEQYPTDSFRSPRTGILYVASANDGHLLRYDPSHREKGLEDLGAIDGGHAWFPTGLDEAPDGAIWIGAYPDATVTRFDPASGNFRRYGSIDPINHYVCPLCGADGTVAVLAINVHPHLVLIDSRTGAHRAVGPFINVEDKSQFLQFFKGVDGMLYLDCHAGKFRVLPGGLEPVRYLPLQMPGVDATYRHAYQEMPPMPGGLIAGWADGEDGAGTYRRIVLRAGATRTPDRTIDLDWHGQGTNVFVIHRGADGMIYGSSFLPEHLFRCAPDGSGMTDLGRCSASLGEAYTMGNFSDGTMAIASYVDSEISLFDPRRPIHYGTGVGDNPRAVGRIDDVGLRPIAMAIVPALRRDGGAVAVPERLWLGSLPYYGTWGGTLGWLEPKSGRRGSHRNLLPDCSPYSLLWLPGSEQLLVGMSIQAGTGAAPRARHGAFVLWDPVADRALYTGDFGIPDLPDVLALAPATGGLVYALLGHTSDTAKLIGAASAPTRIALVDPASRRVLAEAPLPADYGALPEHDPQLCLFPGPGGVYGITGHCLYRMRPGTCETELVWRAPSGDHLDKPGPWIGRTFYFATDWRLRTLTLP